MEHEIPCGNSNRENGTTFLDFPLVLGIFQWDEPTKRVPFTAEPEIPEILTKWKAPQDSGSTSKNYADSGSHQQNFPGFRNLDLYQSRTQISLPFVREIPFASSSERDLGTRVTTKITFSLSLTPREAWLAVIV